MMEKRRLANKPRLIRTTLVLIWLSLNILNLQIGLADNGDWIRVAAWFVTTPTGFEGKVIDNSSALYLIRYFNTWLPFWNIDFMFQGQILSSAILLWFPGVILNTLFFSPTILFLPWLSFVPRLMMLIILLAVFRWIETEANQKQIFYLTLALPLDLVFSTTDYIAYFNTFYQETAAFVGLFFFLGSLYWVQIHYSFLRLSFFIVSASFLILSRSSLIYFAILALVFLVPVFKKQRLWHFIVTSLVLIGVAGLNIGLTSDANMRKMNAFNAIYTGILPFSRHLEEQLINHSLYGSHICIDDIDYFSVARAWCASNYASQINSQTGVRILLDEPAILFRQILFVSSVMQQLNLDNSEYPFFN
ncbi:MAG: hypothetical protein H8E61_01010, partial [Bacteroidetes bacterium]|nr:hypothetical protein [Bacteroidota bacterium]